MHPKIIAIYAVRVCRIGVVKFERQHLMSGQIARLSSSSSSNSRSSGGSKKYPNISDNNNPFDILGIPKHASYEQAKSRFLELAMKHHPDVSENNSKDGGNVDEFVRLRSAFESIRQSEGGTASNNKDEDSWSNDEFQAWFYEETGHQDVQFRMDLATRKEVIDVVNSSQSQGGLDRGGMWEMARSMAEQHENLKKQKANVKPTVGLGAEESKSEPAGARRRRRKK